MKLTHCCLAAGLAVSAGLAGFSDVKAEEYDIDCAVILCLAGGFAVPDCDKPLDYMIDRVTDVPPKPPFGVCTGADGQPYDGASAQPGSLSRSSCVATERVEGDTWCVRWKVTEQRWIDISIEDAHGADPFENRYYRVNRTYYTTTNPRGGGGDGGR